MEFVGKGKEREEKNAKPCKDEDDNVNHDTLSNFSYEMFNSGVTSLRLAGVLYEEEKKRMQAKQEVENINKQEKQQSESSKAKDGSDEIVLENIEDVITAVPSESKESGRMAFNLKALFNIDVEDTVIDMNMIKIPIDPEKIKDVLNDGGVTCTYCYGVIHREHAVRCGKCKRVYYCNSYCAAMDNPCLDVRSLRHNEICSLYTKHNDFDRVGVLDNDVIRHFIAKKLGGGLFACRAFERCKIVLIDRPARETVQEFQAREKAQELIQKLFQSKIQENGYQNTENILTLADKEKILEECNLSVAQTYRFDLFTEKIMIINRFNYNSSQLTITSLPPMYDPGNLDICFTVCMLNHSCKPNVYLYGLDYRYLVLSLTNINAGDQLLIRYDDPYAVLKHKTEEENQTYLWTPEDAQEWYINRLNNQYGIVCPETCDCHNIEYWKHYIMIARLTEELYDQVKEQAEVFKKKGTIKWRKYTAAANAVIVKFGKKLVALETYLNNMPAGEVAKIPPKFFLTIYELEWNVKYVASWKRKNIIERVEQKIERQLRKMNIPVEMFFKSKRPFCVQT